MMFGIAILLALVVPAVLCWAILRRRRAATTDGAGGEYGGPNDNAPLNPVPLREYTPGGSIELENPPPGYTAEGRPRD